MKVLKRKFTNGMKDILKLKIKSQKYTVNSEVDGIHTKSYTEIEKFQHPNEEWEDISENTNKQILLALNKMENNRTSVGELN